MFELSVAENQNEIEFTEHRSKAENILDEFYSVQFFLKGKRIFYQFKLRNSSSNRLCILVNSDSPVFNKLHVGDILEMEYNKFESSDASRIFKTQIASKNPHDCYTGHFIVELSIIDNLGAMIF